MFHLGVSAFLHDSSACLTHNGRIVAFAQEDRFNRDKHSPVFPVQSIKYCLKTAGISVDDLDCVIFFCKPWMALRRRIPLILRYAPKSIKWGDEYSPKFFDMIRFPRIFKGHFPHKTSTARFYFVDHHQAHLASAFFVSPFEDAAILSADGAGEIATAVLARGEGNRIFTIKEVNMPHSLGYYYTSCCQYLGFRHFEYIPDDAEGKVMGLSSYGEPEFIDFFHKLITVTPDGGFQMDLDYFWHQYGWKRYFSDLYVKELGPPRLKTDPLEHRHENIAASLQKGLEDKVLELLHILYGKVGSKNLCLAGGVTLNCVMNGRILRESPFRRIFIQPAAGDSGTTLGGCLYYYHQMKNMPRDFIMEHASWGPEFSDSDCRQALEAKGLRYEYCESIASRVAKLLADGNIVGWYQGRNEVGPRALGNRSILADPRDPGMKDKINSRVKFREPFRPFAPSVLEEDLDEYFEGAVRSPFMLLVFKVKADKQELVPAITHVDGTSRVQSVDKNIQPLYHQMISEFKRITGIPMVLNTSLNVKGEPIVCTPQDAIECFLKTGMDALCLGNYLVMKNSMKNDIIKL